MALFRDRADAGRQLARHLLLYRQQRRALVLALSPAGVPVGYEIADALRIPLDVYIVRELGLPGHEELAMGAVVSDGSYVVDETVVDAAGVLPEDFQRTLMRELTELRRRETIYREDRPGTNFDGKSIIITDDGLTSGASMYSAVLALRCQQPAEIIAAVPVAPADMVRRLEQVADRVVCLYQPFYFGPVGMYYEHVAQVSDGEVRHLMAAAARERVPWTIA